MYPRTDQDRMAVPLSGPAVRPAVRRNVVKSGCNVPPERDPGARGRTDADPLRWARAKGRRAEVRDEGDLGQGPGAMLAGVASEDPVTPFPGRAGARGRPTGGEPRPAYRL